MPDPFTAAGAVLSAVNVLASLLERVSDAVKKVRQATVELAWQENRLKTLLGYLEMLKATLPAPDGATLVQTRPAVTAKRQTNTSYDFQAILSACIEQVKEFLKTYDNEKRTSGIDAAALAFVGSPLNMQLKAIEDAVQNYLTGLEGVRKLRDHVAQELKRGGRTLAYKLKAGYQPYADAFQEVRAPNVCGAVSRSTQTKCDQSLRRCDETFEVS